MSTIRVLCPHCSTQFRVPQEHLGRKGRCAECRTVFVLAVSDMEDSVAEWLAIEEIEGGLPPSAPSPAGASAAARRSRGGRTASTATKTKADAAAPAVEHGHTMRLAHVDSMGAFFVFPSWLLNEESFRASLPRCCLCCGATSNLAVHLIVWTSKLPDRDRMGLTDASVRMHVRTDELAHLAGTDLLAMLPKVPNMPPPFDLPMPYFICNRCSPAGAIMAHVRPTSDVVEQCELGIASLRRAAEFLATNLGRDHDDYRRLLDDAERRRRDPWASMALAVRNRVSQWYHAQDREKFLLYIRDRDFAQTEAGCGGVVVTNRRVIFHKYAAHREAPVTDPLTIDVIRGEKFQMRLSGPHIKPVLFHADPGACDVLRATLRGQGTHLVYRP